jgi:hypothetical protein
MKLFVFSLVVSLPGLAIAAQPKRLVPSSEGAFGEYISRLNKMTKEDLRFEVAKQKAWAMLQCGVNNSLKTVDSFVEGASVTVNNVQWVLSQAKTPKVTYLNNPACYETESRAKIAYLILAKKDPQIRVQIQQNEADLLKFTCVNPSERAALVKSMDQRLNTPEELAFLDAAIRRLRTPNANGGFRCDSDGQVLGAGSEPWVEQHRSADERPTHKPGAPKKDL